MILDCVNKYSLVYEITTTYPTRKEGGRKGGRGMRQREKEADRDEDEEEEEKKKSKHNRGKEQFGCVGWQRNTFHSESDPNHMG